MTRHGSEVCGFRSSCAALLHTKPERLNVQSNPRVFLSYQLNIVLTTSGGGEDEDVLQIVRTAWHVHTSRAAQGRGGIRNVPTLRGGRSQTGAAHHRANAQEQLHGHHRPTRLDGYQ